MKNFIRILLLLCFSIVFVILIGCTNKDIDPLLYKDEKEKESFTPDDKTAKLDYTIDKITLSNSYQSIEPNIELIKNGLDTKLFLSLGLVESSEISIKKIERLNNNVNIHVENQSKTIKSKLVVPQIILNFDNLSSKELETLNFKIINDNYQPIKANIGIDKAISKIESTLKISTSTFPEVKIKKQDDRTFLDLCFKNTVDLENQENPIVNLDVLVDINSAEIVDSKKTPVSSLIDEGEVVRYLTDKYIIYSKKDLQENNTNYNLWIYDIEKDIKKVLYTSNNKIDLLSFNPTGNEAIIIESAGKKSSTLYHLDLDSLNLEKMDIKNDIRPDIALWKEDSIILIDKNSQKSTVYELDPDNGQIEFLSTINKSIDKINYSNNNFLFCSQNDSSSDVYITSDFKENILIDRGSNPSFVNNNTIAYLKQDNDSGEKLLWIYDIEEDTIKNYADFDVEDFFIWKDYIAIIEKNQIGSDNPLSIYNLKTKKIKFKGSVKSNDIYLNTKEDILYINSYILSEEEKVPVISYIDLS